MSAGHSPLGPSVAHRWLRCPGSVALEAQFPNEETPYMAEGTRAHKLGEACLLGACNARDLRESPEFRDRELYPDEMFGYVQQYVDYVWEQASEPDAVFYVESQVHYSQWVKDGFGTADAIVFTPTTCKVIDFKYGKGVRVDATDNEQIKLYALGVYETFAAALGHTWDFELTVHQPRLDHVDSWSISQADLLTWANEMVKPAALEAMQPDARFVPGEKQCRFCRARGSCMARARANQRVINEDFGTPMPMSRLLSAEDLAHVLEQAAEIEQWLKDVRETAEGLLSNGSNVPGWKLVEGRTNRRWIDEEKAQRVIQRKGKLRIAEVTKRSLLGISAIEKLLGKEKAAEILPALIHKPRGAKTLAPVSDKRPAFDPIASAQADFAPAEEAS